MTSANPRGEPLVIDDHEAIQRLAGIADGFITHNRAIRVGCDDSVMAWHPPGPVFIRRARGYTPRRIVLPKVGLATTQPSVLACGAWLKNTLCLTRGNQAYLSQHIGDLDNAASCRALEEVASHLLKVLQIEPERVAHDLHPDFFSSQWAKQFARQRGLPCLAVQHHHAHVAAVMADHQLTGPVIGVALDGVGMGTDGSSWGGELLWVAGGDWRRLGHLQLLPLPGGDRAAREPWRMAVAVAHRLGYGDAIGQRFCKFSTLTLIPPLIELLERQSHTPLTSSAGRWFDAAAALLGIREVNAYEGQAAMELEAWAHRYGSVTPLMEGYRITTDHTLELLPLLERLFSITDPGYGAALFHATLAQALTDWIEQAAGRCQISRVVLAGGCFLNRILSMLLRQQLQNRGLAVYGARQLPPNDGGISLGQAWVAMHQTSIEEKSHVSCDSCGSH